MFPGGQLAMVREKCSSEHGYPKPVSCLGSPLSSSGDNGGIVSTAGAVAF